MLESRNRHLGAIGGWWQLATRFARPALVTDERRGPGSLKAYGPHTF